MSKTATKTPDDEDRCPNCGYCPHCGQSTKQPVVPMPYPVPAVPYRRPIYWEEGVSQPYRVWCGTTTNREGSTELRSVSNEYVSRKEGNC